MIRIFVVSVSLLVAQSALADGACKSLEQFVGTYRQVSKTCEDQFKCLGPELTVRPYAEKTYSGYWIESNGSAYGPTTSDVVGDVDKCTVQGSDVLVEISGNNKGGSSLPAYGRFYYKFSGSSVAFTADGCTAVYFSRNSEVGE